MAARVAESSTPSADVCYALTLGTPDAVLSLDAADMSGVHNTDFASNGEVHKVRTLDLQHPALARAGRQRAAKLVMRRCDLVACLHKEQPGMRVTTQSRTHHRAPLQALSSRCQAVAGRGISENLAFPAGALG